MSLHRWTVPTHIHMLEALGGQLAKAEAFANDRGEASSDMLTARLAPDMFPLATQVRFACFQSLECMDRLTGAAVRAIDTVAGIETIAAARALIAETVRTLKSADPTLWDGAETRPVEIVLPGDLIFDMTGEDFVRDWALAQFYFHIVTAYAILRRHGVGLGKADYVPYMFAYARKRAE
ncbi:DUF1993 domain-containing protein [Fulvimarina sp. 2208YS6-2-32]|uniref:DUF1993 domain-containing protein n=1 Tax=Fulvimarina uroteuthidis TaxID=3098149 RepID=A0ABU5I0X2_9HYPH|nr:DUF1993 domain-containing protein [Fulvimarina sp. 2208YS6-2-32]MDY8108997.1 DUF1993 domain-containing protein [Fulvimarina sp. 2208YS6-2-32]